MTTYIHTLKPIEISSDTHIHNPNRELKEVSLSDPAVDAMTDLKKVTAITIDTDSSIDLALEVMRHAGVRLLLVVDKEEMIVGLITARDIMGEKPLTISERERITHEEIQVHHAMTSRDEINFYDFTDVAHANVQDVIVKLKNAGRQHSIVLEKNADGSAYQARGIFSITQIGKQLGMEISNDGHVQSFSEFEQLIANG